MERPISVLFCALVFVAGFLGRSDFALGAEDDEAFQTSGPSAQNAAADKVKRRDFIGARDEGRLEIQTSLAQPTRNPDGSSVILDEADEPVTAPASD